MTSSTSEPSKATSLIESVVNGGYCIGCGACAVSPDSPFQIKMNEHGCYEAEVNPAIADVGTVNKAAALAACPFSGHGENENEIAKRLFSGNEGTQFHDRVGYHLSTYAGHVVENGYRSRGSSGGIGSWVLSELFRLGKIDAAIHVGAVSSGENGKLFEFKISRSLEEINERAKSRYYPIEMSAVLSEVLKSPGRYALVGIPCYIKAFRLLAQQHPELRDRIQYTVAIVCGHLKSTGFAELFSWQCGIQPGDLESIDFRHKIDGQSANLYGIEVKGKRDGRDVVDCKTNADYYGSNWGHGLFKYSACDYCDDVLGETGDIAIGDAWLPGYVEDSKGTNVVVVRDPRIQELIDAGIAEKRLQLDAIDADTVAASQDAGLRHRREGLQYRLLLKDQQNEWRPPKRVTAAEDHLTEKQKTIFKLRIDLAAESHRAFLKAKEAGSFDVFKGLMKKLQDPYDEQYAPPFIVRLRIKIGAIIQNLRSKF